METYTDEQIRERLFENERFMKTDESICFYEKHKHLIIKRFLNDYEKEGFNYNKIVDSMLQKLRM